MMPGPVIISIGEIAVTSTVIHTPAGDIPLAGSTWHVVDHWRHERVTPRWAIVLAIVCFCVTAGLGLLFLLVKQTVEHGTVQITVTNGAQHYVTQLPVADRAQLADINQQVNYVRSLAAL